MHLQLLSCDGREMGPPLMRGDIKDAAASTTCEANSRAVRLNQQTENMRIQETIVIMSSRSIQPNHLLEDPLIHKEK